MPVKTACPGCQAPYTLADAMRGKKVRCKQCQEVFTVGDAAAGVGIQTEPAPAAGPARAGGATAPPPLPPHPAGPAPLPRRRPESLRGGPQQSNALLWILLASGGGVLLVAGIVVTAILVARSSSDDPGPIAPGGLPPGAMGPGQPAPPNQGPGLVKASSTRFALEVQDHHIDDIFFAAAARQVGCYSWDGKNLFNKRLALYDIQTGQRTCLLDLGSDLSAGNVELSADATRLARIHTQGFTRTLTIWSLPDGQVLFPKWNPYPRDKGPFRRPNPELLWCAFLDRDRLLTVARNGQYDLFNMAEKKRIYSIPPVQGQERLLECDLFSHRPRNLALSPDRKTLALSNRNGFDLIDTATGRLRVTAPLNQGQPGNEWALVFSPDGSRLAAKLNRFDANNRQQEYVVVWDAVTGQQTALLPITQNLGVTNPLAWWGSKHLVIYNSGRTEGHLLSLTDGRFWRICERGGQGKLAGGTPDGRLWCATSLRGFPQAEMCAVDLPEDQLLLQPPPADPGQQWPRWYIRPDGVATERGR